MAAILLLTVDPSLGTQAESGWDQFKRQKLTALETEISRLAKSTNNHPAFEAFKKQIEAIDKLTLRLEQSLELVKSWSAVSPLDQILASSQPVTNIATDDFKGADQIIRDSQELFSTEKQLDAQTPEQSARFRRYYTTVLRAASAYITEQARVAMAAGQDTSVEVQDLYLVLPLLETRDAEWSAKHVDALPVWMKRPEHLHDYEDFCLRIGRYQTAYQFALAWARAPAGPPKTTSYLAYLVSSAQRLKGWSHEAHQRALGAAIDLAQAGGQQNTLVDLHMRLAKAHNANGQADLAAQQMQHILELAPSGDQFGRAVILRLKYLYAGKDFARIAEEAITYENDRRCKTYLPQILYIAWVTAQRADNAKEAARLSSTVLLIAVG